MHRSHEAAKLAELLRASLAEVVDAANVCGHRPIKVSPRTIQQVQSILRVCDFHKVGWSLESGSKMGEGAEPGEVDVVLSLALLIASTEAEDRTSLSSSSHAGLKPISCSIFASRSNCARA